MTKARVRTCEAPACADRQADLEFPAHPAPNHDDERHAFFLLVARWPLAFCPYYSPILRHNSLLALHRPPPAQRCLCHLPKSSFCFHTKLYLFRVPSHPLFSLLPTPLPRGKPVSVLISIFLRRRAPMASSISGVLRAMITRMLGVDLDHFSF